MSEFSYPKRLATKLELVKRVMGFKSEAEAVYPDVLQWLMPVPGERQQNTMKGGMLNNQVAARRMVAMERLREKSKADARRKKKDDQQKLYMDRLFETYDEAPEGKPSYYKGAAKHPMEIMDAANMNRQMNKPEGKVQL